MDKESQKTLIKVCQPLSRDDLFNNNLTVCIIPLDWWYKWCNYVGYYNEDSMSQENPGDLNTSSIILEKDYDHVYISKAAWKYLKSWYCAGKKVEVFIVNKKIEARIISVNVLVTENQALGLEDFTKTVKISPNLTLGQIKNYLCTKFSKEPEYHKVLLKKKNGEIRKFTSDEVKLKRKSLEEGVLVLKKTKKIQYKITLIEDDVLMTSYSSTNHHTFANNLEIEMNEFGKGVENIDDFAPVIDYSKIEKIKEQIRIARSTEKQIIKIKSLKCLNKNMEIIGSVLDSLNNI